MKFLVIIISFFIGIIIFMPVENLFFTLEKKISKQNIYINTTTSTSITNLYLYNLTIFQKNKKIAFIKKGEIIPLIVFNKINLSDISIKNIHFSKITLTHTIFNPVIIEVLATSNIGKFKGIINLKKRFLKIYISNIKQNKIKSFLHKDKKGFFYEKIF